MKTDIERLKEKFDQSDGCWQWKAGRCRHGYGRFSLGGEKIGAHRAAYQLLVGPIPSGLLVMHSCDNPCCVRPDHLLLGAPIDNMLDKVSKGRQAKGAMIVRGRRSYNGSGGPNAKLTDEQALAIIKDQRRHAEIAADYGVTRGAISHLKRGHTWPHLNRQPLNYPKLGVV